MITGLLLVTMPRAYLEARTMGFCIRRFKNSDQHAWNVGTSASFVVKGSQRSLIYTHFLKFCSLLKQQSHFLFLLSNVKKKKCVALDFNCHLKMETLCPYMQSEGERELKDFSREWAGCALPAGRGFLRHQKAERR